MEIVFPGTASVIPDPGRDTITLLIDGKHLFDNGWWPIHRLQTLGIEPGDLETLVFSHFHHDHYMGLPQILLYRGLRGINTLLRVAGPAEYLQEVVQLSEAFLQCGRFPELKQNLSVEPLIPGETTSLGTLRLHAISARHTSGKDAFEPALCFRIEDPATGGSLVFSGDTSFHPPLIDLARGADVLVHDAGHTRPADAARIAQDAGVGRLLLAHFPTARADEFLAEAVGVFPQSELAWEGARILI